MVHIPPCTCDFSAWMTSPALQALRIKNLSAKENMSSICSNRAKKSGIS
jgi:hypothetical protein